MAPRLSCFVDECADDENYLLISDAHRMSGVVSFFSLLSPVESCVIPPVLFTIYAAEVMDAIGKNK